MLEKLISFWFKLHLFAVLSQVTEMALEILGLLVGPVTEVVKLVGKPILRQFNYLCCFNSNKQDLMEKAEKLKEKREEVQSRVSAAENNVEEILPAATTWLREVDVIQGNNYDIDNHIRDVKSGCLAVKSRFLLSRRVKKTAEDMEKLLQGCPKSDEPISRRRPPPSVEVPDIPETPATEFESRKQIEDYVMAILKDEKVSVTGICGMGGLGKTTLAEKIKDRVKVEHLFGESVMAVVSQQPDELKIQAELAENLGLDLKDDTALSSRAHKLRNRLTKGEKRILVILDDVWEDLKLEKIGIQGKGGPHGCIILLTSRDRNVLVGMNAEPVCEMKILSEIEAWSLFQQNVGACLDDPTLLSTAQDVVKECKGLPLALVTVARALKGHDIPTWHEALRELKDSNPEDLETVLKDVYTPLKLSYDFLTENAKSIFLLCCLFPEDSDIPLESLTAYAMGLRMFGGISSLGRVRNKTYSLVGKLKSRCLLLEGKNEHHVRMHDVVRDVAIFIASSKEKQLIRCGDKCAWISPFSGERNELSKTANFPNLRLLLIQGDKWEINDKHFEGAINLNVLSMSGIYSMKSSLPHTTILLKGLRTLILDSMRLETISVVGDLENLEIFICRNCPHIKMLPADLRRLVRLKLLEFSYCDNLKRVEPGIISSLVGLENLKMIYSFNGWEAERSEGKQRKNAALSELQSLSSLTCLTIEIEDSRLVAEQFKLPRHVNKYEIFISSHLGDYPTISSDREFERKMCLYLAEKKITPSENWFVECISRVECMLLEGEWSNIVDLRQVHQKMRKLSLEGSSGVEKLVNMSSSIGSTATIFPELEHLCLESLSNLEEICHIEGPLQDGSSIDAFHNLKTLYLDSLPALKHWWKSSPYQHNAPLPQLQELTIRRCEMMEQVLLWTEEKNENEIGTILFPKLKTLKLSRLPSLTSFSKGIFEGVGFPLLTQVVIEECPQLKSLVSNYHDEDEDEDSSRLFSKLVVSSNRLERFVIIRCGKIRSLFSSSIGQNLCNLNELIINDCEEMIELFEDDNGKTSRVFPKLQKLEMIALPKLKEFCESAQMEFPLLKEVSILGCPEMERLSSGSVTAPNLKVLRVGFKDIAINTGQDLNAELQLHLSIAMDEESFYKWVLKVNKWERMSELWMGFKTGNCLTLVIKDSTQAAEQISFPSDILRYEITIGTIEHYFVNDSYDRKMKLNLPTNIILGNWIHHCVRSVEYMQLQGEGSNNLDLGQAQNMRGLALTDCSTVKNLVNIIPPSTDGVRDHLEFLKLVNLPSLEEIYPTPEESSFNNLKEIYLKDLPALKHLWKSNSPNATILQLKRLWIMNCEMIEQIFSWNDENDTGSGNHPITMIFPNLTQLRLSNLPRLKVVCNGIIESIKLPRLSWFNIKGCPQLKSLVSTVNDNRKMNWEGIDNGGDECLHIFCKQAEKVDFSGLKNLSIGEIENINSIWCHQILIKDFFARLECLTIYKLDNLRSLFSSSIVTNFNNLSKLNISKCGEMVEVIEDDNKVDTDASSEMTTVCVFPKLKYLQMGAMPKLEKFCGWKSCALQLPSLKEMGIDSCPEMKIFSLGSVTAPYQVSVEIDRNEVINNIRGLNVMLQQPVFRGDPEEVEKKKEEEEGREEIAEKQPS